MARKNTNELLEVIEECGLETETVLMACLKYMSEQDVTDMIEANGFLDHEVD